MAKKLRKYGTRRKRMNALDWISFILVIIGAVNWGLAVFNQNLVTLLIPYGWLQKVIYGLVGAAGLYGVYTLIMLAMRKKY